MKCSAWIISLLGCMVLLFTSCKKEYISSPVPQNEVLKTQKTNALNTRKGIAVLNRAGYVLNSYTPYAGALNYYDFDSGKFYPDIFKTVNGIDLGTTPSAVKIYGSKMYILTIEAIQVVDPKTGRLIKSVKSHNLNMNDIVFYKRTAYISNSLGVISPLDTATLETYSENGVGFASTGMVVVNDKLFAVGGEYYNFFTGKMLLGNRVYVTNPNTHESIKTIPFPDPHNITKDKYGNVYVTSNDALGIINSTTNNLIYQNNSLRAATGLDPNSLVIADNYALMRDVNRTRVSVFDIRTKQIIKNNFISDGTIIRPDVLTVDEENREIYIRDHLSGVMYVFDEQGKKKRTLGNHAFGTGKPVFINR